MKFNLKHTIILLLLIFVISIYIKDSEKFVPYETLPRTDFNYWRTGSQPLNFYKLPLYRKPYRFPFRFFKSYPIPHMSTFRNL